MTEKTRGVATHQDPHTSGLTKASHAAKSVPRLGVPEELMKPHAWTMTKREYEEWEKGHDQRI